MARNLCLLLLLPALLVTSASVSAKGYVGCLLHDFNIKWSKMQVITAIVPDSPASKAGLRLYDVITSVDGNSSAQLAATLERYQPGYNVVLDINRSGKYMKVSVELAECPVDGTLGILEEARKLIEHSANAELRHSVEEWPVATSFAMWHDSKGQYEVEARYISSDDSEVVLLRKTDNHAMHIKPERLDNDAHAKLDQIHGLESQIEKGAAQLWQQSAYPDSKNVTTPNLVGDQKQSPKSDDSPLTVILAVIGAVFLYYFVKAKNHELRTTTPCTTCYGKGGYSSDPISSKCPYCPSQYDLMFNPNYRFHYCHSCRNTGIVTSCNWIKCTKCRGSGRVPISQGPVEVS